MKIDALYVGPAGWHYPDWNGVFYPASAKRSGSQLAYVAQFFNLVEINTSFYRIPEPASVQNWQNQVATAPDFKFIAKLFQGFTHEASPCGARDRERFVAAFAPLYQSGRLCTVLAQYPWRVKYEEKALDAIVTMVQNMQPLPLHLEFRHASWFNEQVLSRLRDQGIGWVNIDQPVIGASLAPTQTLTTSLAYIRLHGRNYQTWFDKAGSRDLRYDYCYNRQELQEWAQTIQKISAQAQKTVVVFNNHFRGQAIVNTLQMLALLSRRPPLIPPQLAEAYPVLREYGYLSTGQQSLNF